MTRTWKRIAAGAWPVMLAAAIALAGAAGCQGKDKGADTTPRADADRGEPVSEKGKRWDGWRWKGARDDCFFVVDNKCFDDQAKACKAARCKPGACKVEGGGPATVSCK